MHDHSEQYHNPIRILVRGFLKSLRITASASSPRFNTYCSLTRSPPGDLLEDVRGERPAPVVNKCGFAPTVTHGADGCVCKFSLELAYGKRLSAARLLYPTAMNMKVLWTMQNDRSKFILLSAAALCEGIVEGCSATATLAFRTACCGMWLNEAGRVVIVSPTASRLAASFRSRDNENTRRGNRVKGSSPHFEFRFHERRGEFHSRT